MTHLIRKTSALAAKAGGRRARLVFLGVAIGLGGWMSAQLDVSKTIDGFARKLDRTLWTQALRDSPAPTDLRAVAPLWREREGASGDRILERVAQRKRLSESAVAVLNDVGGEAIPAPVAAERAAVEMSGEASDVEPIRFDGLTAGDRLTITTANGEVYAFEVVAPENDASPDSVTVTVRRISPEGDGESVIHSVTPLKDGDEATAEAQREL
ncbi:MAG: hypothetical protein ACLFPA_06255 [Dichotomicrobium sp.]